MLLERGSRVVLPPPFLCCGFPAHVNAKTEQYGNIVLRNSVMFSQIREMFSYIDFDACIVTCGTCMEGLEAIEADRLFGGKIKDIAGFLQEKGLTIEGTGKYLYHAPCHDSLSGKALEAMESIGGFGSVTPVPHCCSEAGTLSLSRPDITDSMLQRKRVAISEAMHGASGAVMLTNCPSCVQGLGRNRDIGLDPQHLAVALAVKYSGTNWAEKFMVQAGKATAVNF